MSALGKLLTARGEGVSQSSKAAVLPKSTKQHVMTTGAPGVDPAHLLIDGKKVEHHEVAGILAQKHRERRQVHARSVDPPQTESRVVHGPHDMTIDADVLFDHRGTQVTGKVVTWGEGGVRVITKSGKHDVPYKALRSSL